jgi:hypothetical protein
MQNSRPGTDKAKSFRPDRTQIHNTAFTEKSQKYMYYRNPPQKKKNRKKTRWLSRSQKIREKYLEVKHEATEGGDNVGYDLLFRVLVSLGGHLQISRIKCCRSIDKETYGIPEVHCIFGSDCIPTVIRGSVIPTREVNSSRFSCESGFSF